MTKQSLVGTAPLIRIVDDDRMMRRSWEFLLKAAHYETVSYEDPIEYLEKDDANRPGCLLLDVRMPQMSGLELQDVLQIRGIELPVVFITGHGDIDMAVHAFRHGACDFLQKPVDEKELLAALKKAVGQDIRRRATRKAQTTNEERYATLTDREREVVKMVAKGLMNKVIADQLGISERTVQIHRGVACRKLQAKTAIDILLLLQSIDQAPV